MAFVMMQADHRGFLTTSGNQRFVKYVRLRDDLELLETSPDGPPLLSLELSRPYASQEYPS